MYIDLICPLLPPSTHFSVPHLPPASQRPFTVPFGINNPEFHWCCSHDSHKYLSITGFEQPTSSSIPKWLSSPSSLQLSINSSSPRHTIFLLGSLSNPCIQRVLWDNKDVPLSRAIKMYLSLEWKRGSLSLGRQKWLSECKAATLMALERAQIPDGLGYLLRARISPGHLYCQGSSTDFHILVIHIEVNNKVSSSIEVNNKEFSSIFL